MITLVVFYIFYIQYIPWKYPQQQYIILSLNTLKPMHWIWKIKTFMVSKRHRDITRSLLFNLGVEVCLYVLQDLVQLGKASGGQLAVDGPIGADAADSHVHISTVHLQRASDESLVCCTHTLTQQHRCIHSPVPVAGWPVSCPAGLSCMQHWC